MRYIFLAFIFSFSTFLSAQNPIPKSRVEGPVNDFANILTSSQRDALARKLVSYANETSTQLVLVTEQSLKGDDDFNRAMAIYDDWKIGEEGKDNGVLLYVAKDDRKVRFVTGYGAEGFLPDAMARRLIENIIVPNFKNGNFYNGIDRAFDAVRDLAKGEYTNDNPRSSSQDANGFPVFLLIILIIIIFVVIARNSGGGDDDDDGGYYRGGRYDMDRRRRSRRRSRNRRGGGGGWIFIPGGGGWDGGGGGGGGFGGFDGGFSGGFGGGMSGGGGAGGSW